MRCLITGVTGFVGTHLAELLLAARHEVVGTSWPELPPEGRSPVRLRHCNILDAAGVLNLVEEARPEWVFHLAGMSSPIDSLASPRPVYEVNFLGALNLLAALQKAVPRALWCW